VEVLGGVPLVASFADMVAVEAVVGVARDPIRRLGALAVFIAEDAERLSERLRLSNAEHDRLRAMGEGAWRIDPAHGEKPARELLYRLGAERFVDRVLLAWARTPAEAGDAAWLDLANLPERWAPPRFPLKAADFMKRGLEPGPALGMAMRAAEEAWIEADFVDDAAVLERIVVRAVAKVRTRM